MLPDVVADLHFSLDSFEFTPQAHNFTLKLAEKPEFRFPEQGNRLYARILSYIFKKAAGSKRAIEILRQNLNKTGFLSWDDGLIAIDLDKHPEKEKLFGKRVPIIGAKIFDFIGIKEIIFGDKRLSKLKIYSHELKNCHRLLNRLLIECARRNLLP